MKTLQKGCFLFANTWLASPSSLISLLFLLDLYRSEFIYNSLEIAFPDQFHSRSIRVRISGGFSDVKMYIKHQSSMSCSQCKRHITMVEVRSTNVFLNVVRLPQPECDSRWDQTFEDIFGALAKTSTLRLGISYPNSIGKRTVNPYCICATPQQDIVLNKTCCSRTIQFVVLSSLTLFLQCIKNDFFPF